VVDESESFFFDFVFKLSVCVCGFIRFSSLHWPPWPREWRAAGWPCGRCTFDRDEDDGGGLHENDHLNVVHYIRAINHI
jgi:hypothetical protein